jgi:hypothetical protein
MAGEIPHSGYGTVIRYQLWSGICGEVAGIRYTASEPTGEKGQREGGGERGHREQYRERVPPFQLVKNVITHKVKSQIKFRLHH